MAGKQPHTGVDQVDTQPSLEPGKPSPGKVEGSLWMGRGDRGDRGSTQKSQGQGKLPRGHDTSGKQPAANVAEPEADQTGREESVEVIGEGPVVWARP